MSGHDDYSGAAIIKNPWPAWELDDGHWERTWRLELDGAVATEVTASQLTVEGLDVRSARQTSPGALEVRARATGNHLSDEIFFYATARLFVRVEEVVGRLKTIQGQPRELWRPFR